MPPVRIAIIGSGMAGLSASYFLSRQAGVHVTVLERAAMLGMDSHRVDVPWDGQTVSIDVPSRMFNSLQWPSLIRLYDEIGVAYEAVDASQSLTSRAWSAAGPSYKDSTYLKFDVAFRPDLGLAQWVGGKQRTILTDAKRLMDQGRRDLDSGACQSQTLGSYLRGSGYSDAFIDEFLYPTLSSTVCTCSYESLDGYPAQVMLNALRNLSDDRALYRTRFGTRDVVRRLSAGIEDVRLNQAVQSVIDQGGCVNVTFVGGNRERFDHVVMATQANTAMTLQPGIQPAERAALDSIPYENVYVVVHQDKSLMPADDSQWRTFNMITGSNDLGKVDCAFCTVWLNRFDPKLKSMPDLFQTISTCAVEVDNPLAKVKLQRPVVSEQSLKAISEIQQLQTTGDRRIWYCGSWACEGIPLLESAVVSARQVVADFVSAPAEVQ